jgi:hypothetical protein
LIGARTLPTGEEEPGIAAGLHDRLAGAVGEHPRVVGPVDGVGRARLAGQVGSRGAGVDEDLALVLGDLVHRECHAGIGRVDDHVDAFGVVPLVRDLRADVRLVLVVGEDHLDVEALLLRLEVLDRHFRGDHGALPGEVRVQAGLVVQDADLHDVTRDLGMCRAGRKGQGRGRDQYFSLENHCDHSS